MVTHWCWSTCIEQLLQVNAVFYGLVLGLSLDLMRVFKTRASFVSLRYFLIVFLCIFSWLLVVRLIVGYLHLICISKINCLKDTSPKWSVICRVGIWTLLIQSLITTSRPAIAGNPRCKNITAKTVPLTSLYPTALTSTNDHLSVSRHYVCT